MIKDLKPVPQLTTFRVVKSTFGEITAIFFLFMLLNIITKFAFGIDGDDTYTDYVDEVWMINYPLSLNIPTSLIQLEMSLLIFLLEHFFCG